MPNQSTLYRADLTTIDGEMPSAELVLCWEVAEHLDEQYADHLCSLLDQCTEQTLLFTAATLGQGGSGHVNEQPHQYWIDKLKELGLTYVWPVTEALRGEWMTLAPRAPWYAKNILVFHR
jgi:hypothetical protein